MTLTQKTITGIIWNFAEQFGSRGTSGGCHHPAAGQVPGARRLRSGDHDGSVSGSTTSLMDSGFNQALTRLQEAKQAEFQPSL